MAAFEKQKVSCLSQVDLSKKGSIDDEIMDLVQYVNAKDNYFTTSSCSGRISIFSEVGQFAKEILLCTVLYMLWFYFFETQSHIELEFFVLRFITSLKIRRRNIVSGSMLPIVQL